VNVTFGVKTLLLLLAVLLFILAVFNDGDTYANLLAWGLASVAGALLLTDIGWDRKLGGGMNRRSSGP
jgi:uncharacterized integral membrane protein